MTTWAVVVAAGSGTRFGAAKQFVPLNGRPLVQWSVEAAHHVADGVVLVLPAASLPGPDRRLGADVTVAGAATRSGSVRCGLAAEPADADVVVVHDGARPLAAPRLFAAVVEAVRSGADAAVPGVGVVDTLKRVRPAPGGAWSTVVATVDRQDLVAVQTPQAFRGELLRRVHAAGAEASDDAGLVEAAGGTVQVVAGDPCNLKVTTPEDLVLVEALAASALHQRGTGDWR